MHKDMVVFKDSQGALKLSLPAQADIDCRLFPSSQQPT